MDQSQVVLDIDFGLSQLSGNRALLLTLLDKFISEYQTLDKDLEKLVSNKEYDQAYSLVHTLKGVTGNLGLFALHHKSKSVEALIRNEKRLPDDYSDFVALLEQTVQAINGLSAEEEVKTPVSEAPQDALADQALSQFSQALKASEFISQTKLDQWMDALSLDEAKRQAIEDAVDELDYDEALALLESK